MKARMVDSNSAAFNTETSFVYHNGVFVENGTYGYIKVRKDECYYVKCGGAVEVTQVRTDLDTYEKTLILQFYDSRGELMEIEMPRKELTDSGVLKLVTYGVQVNKNSAVTLIKCIENSEVNATVVYQHSKLGFGYFRGNLIFKYEKGIGIESEYSGRYKIKPQGSKETWLSMVQEHVLGTPMEIILGLALSAVTVDYIYESYPIDNLLVSLTGNSTTGKTTALIFAVSLAASPSPYDDSFMLSFADTELSILNKIESSFPVGLDESSLLKGSATKILYALANGRERSRLRKDLSTKEPKDFRTTVFMSGEQSILEMADATGGLRARLMDFVNITWTSSAQSSEYIKKTCMSNYGWITPEYARYLLEYDKEALVERCVYWSEQFMKGHEDDSNSAIIGRMAKKVGVVLATSELAEKTLGIKMNIKYIKEFFFEHLMADEEEFDIGIKAYGILISYYAKNPDLFGEPLNVPQDIPDSYYKEGRVKDCEMVELYDGTYSNQILCISKEAFDRVLKRNAFRDSKVILRRMKELDLLVSDKDRYISRFKLGINDVLSKGYRIRIPNMDKDEKTVKEVKTVEVDEDILEWEEE